MQRRSLPEGKCLMSLHGAFFFFAVFYGKRIFTLFMLCTLEYNYFLLKGVYHVSSEHQSYNAAKKYPAQL